MTDQPGPPQSPQPEFPQQPPAQEQPSAQQHSEQPHLTVNQGHPTPNNDQRQWVHVPTTPIVAASSHASPPAGKALAISAMALGLVALLSAIVFGLYFSVFVIGAALIGLVAVVLGIVALVKRSRPKAAAVTGLVTGALSLFVALLLGTLGVVAFVTNVFGGLAGEDQGTGQGSPESGEHWTPDDQREALIEWPADMATGGIVFEGPGDPHPVSAEPLAPGTSPAPHQIDRDRVNDVLIYVDYRCPHCASFEQTNGALLEAAIAAGDTTVEIVPLSFLDRASEGAYYSSRAAGAMACVVDQQPERAWVAHRTLLDPAVQPGQGPGLSNTELVTVLERNAGLNSGARSCIEQERFVTFAQALNNWVFANPVPNANDQGSRISGTPSVFVNGEFYAGPTDDAASFAQFFEEQTH